MKSPSTVFLLPSLKYWNTTEPIVCGAKRDYTVQNYKQLFRDIRYNDGFNIWFNMKDKFDPSVEPGVETHVLYGSGIPTELQYIYPPGMPKWYDHDPIIDYGDGDGTVNAISLIAFLHLWEQKRSIYHFEVKGSQHREMLSDPRVLDYIDDILCSYNL
ncbi:hypothetical protein ACOME3_001140 [Neoechinorhynchus agilis]